MRFRTASTDPFIGRVEQRFEPFAKTCSLHALVGVATSKHLFSISRPVEEIVA